MRQVEALGDLALVVGVPEVGGVEDWRRVGALARRIEASGIEGVVEVVAALDSVAVHLERAADWAAVAEAVEAVVCEDPGVLDDVGQEVVVPVCYGGEAGPDLGRVAAVTGLSEAQVAERHAAGRYRVRAVGFAPGFPYLEGLDEGLACGRLETPRTRVVAGSVGIGGLQTGVYPVELPGGWNLIGRTGLRLFDPEAERPNLLQPGDVVRFEVAGDGGGGREAANDEAAGGGGAVEVLDPGLSATVQDLGRTGWQGAGVTEGGAMDRRAMRVGNLLVGNEEGLAGLEWAFRGPRLRFRDRRVVAVTGAGAVGVARARPFVVEAGERLDLAGMPGGAWGYLAIEGGIDVPEVLGGRGTHRTGRFGGLKGREVRSGDVLGLGERRVGALRGGWFASLVVAPPAGGEGVRVRVMRGPEAGRCGEPAWQRLVGEEWTVTRSSDRMGMRLEGGEIEVEERLEMVSQPVVAGTVQVPGDGRPIVMMADRQTLGGYPRIAVVVSVDVPVVAQLAPGSRFRFVECGLEEAQALRMREERDLELFALAVGERVDPV